MTGSAAALFHGLEIEPGDLDVTPALDRDNLERLAAALTAAGARPDPEAGFGDWVTGPDGERRWVRREPTAKDVEWRLDPGDPASFDYLFESAHGAIDVVPEVGGTYDELIARAVEVDGVWVESVEDLLARITVPRRDKDADRVRRLRELQRRTIR